MSGNRYYRRVDPDPGDRLRAGLIATGLAASVACVSYYLARLFFSRERLDPLTPPSPGKDPEKRRGGQTPL